MLSIIIATHKRASTLHTCLEHLAKQTIATELEVVIVSDGPDAATKKVAQEQWSIPVYYSEIKKSQQGIARNHGVTKANGEWCMFINDDIFLEPNACALHVQALEQCNTAEQTSAVLGFITWDPSLQINKTMRFLEKSGWQFGYPKITQYQNNYVPAALQANFTYSSQISLAASVAKQHLFTATQVYGWEDIEWGQRLQTAGIALWYEPCAIGYHHHHITLEQSLKRMEIIGKAHQKLQTIQPGFNQTAQGIKWYAKKAIALLPTLRGKHEAAFFRGLKK